MISVRVRGAVFLVGSFACDDEAIADKIKKRSCGVLGDQFHRIFVHSLGFKHWAGQGYMLAVGGENPAHGVDHIGRGNGGAVVECVSFVQIKDPSVGVFDLPALRETALVLAGREIV